MRRYKGKYDIFFGTEHRLRKEEMQEQFSKEGKEGWTFGADAAKITDETAGCEDRRHTSGEVFVAVDSSRWTRLDPAGSSSEASKNNQTPVVVSA